MIFKRAILVECFCLNPYWHSSCIINKLHYQQKKDMSRLCLSFSKTLEMTGSKEIGQYLFTESLSFDLKRQDYLGKLQFTMKNTRSKT